MGLFILGFTADSKYQKKTGIRQLNVSLFPRRKRVVLDDLPSAKWMGLVKLGLCHLQMNIPNVKILNGSNHDSPLIFRKIFLQFLDATHEFLIISAVFPAFPWLFPIISLAFSHHFAAPIRPFQKPCSGMMRIRAVALPFCFFLRTRR